MRDVVGMQSVDDYIHAQSILYNVKVNFSTHKDMIV